MQSSSTGEVKMVKVTKMREGFFFVVVSKSRHFDAEKPVRWQNDLF